MALIERVLVSCDGFCGQEDIPDLTTVHSYVLYPVGQSVRYVDLCEQCAQTLNPLYTRGSASRDRRPLSTRTSLPAEPESDTTVVAETDPPPPVVAVTAEPVSVNAGVPSPPTVVPTVSPVQAAPMTTTPSLGSSWDDDESDDWDAPIPSFADRHEPPPASEVPVGTGT